VSVTDNFAITARRTGTTTRVVASGELDIATAPALREHIERVLDDDFEIVVVDLSDVSFIDSSGLHTLLQAARRQPNRLRIVPSMVCVRLFDLVGVRDRLPLIDTPG
jgi:anti-anti-sigma factor